MRHARRLPLVVLAAAALVAGVWGGLFRMQAPVPLPDVGDGWPTFHGPLMVAAFLGTLIALERAVALGARAAYVVPIVSGLGGGVLIALPTGGSGPWLLAAGAAGYVALGAVIVRRQRAVFTVLPAVGGVALFAANVAWATGVRIPLVVPGWIAFLVLTIVGERPELARMRRPVHGERGLLWIATGGLAVGAVAAPLVAWGTGLLGAALVALAAWLLTFDIARRTIRLTGLPRFVAVCLLAGYVWLGVGGVLFVRGAPLASGLAYDGALHAVFLGFAFSMIFGHAPIVLPAVLGVRLPLTRFAYVPVVLLHAAVATRITADVAEAPEWRTRAGLVAATAILLFAVGNVVTIVRGREARQPDRPA